jgi:UDP-N-acetylglucosamine 2-epimerase (non-hydrolysing)
MGVRKNIFCVFGTRPEAIKMVPVVLALRERPKEFRCKVLVTAQHRGMLDQVLDLFRVKSDYDLDIMRDGQTLTDVTTRALQKLEPIFKKDRPDLVLVHGDTTTTLAAALASYYQKIPVGHVEAGLRSGDMLNPYPEEANRRLGDALCSLHFAPTASSKKNLRKENISPKGIFVTGNTGIDALKIGVARVERGAFPKPSAKLRAIAANPFILMTAHRRENFGKPMRDICGAVRRVARARPDVHFVYPVHPNPNVAGPVKELLSGLANVHLLKPLDYGDMLYLMRKARLVLTDSGGLQEEAPSLGKPVLVMRRVTERPEAVKAGTVQVIGTDQARLEKSINRLLDDKTLYRRMAEAVNPYGDGRAAERTVEAIRHYFRFRNTRPSEFKSR